MLTVLAVAIVFGLLLMTACLAFAGRFPANLRDRRLAVARRVAAVKSYAFAMLLVPP